MVELFFVVRKSGPDTFVLRDFNIFFKYWSDQEKLCFSKIRIHQFQFSKYWVRKLAMDHGKYWAMTHSLWAIWYLSSRRFESLNRSESVVPRRSDNGGRPPCRRSILFGEALLWLLIGWGEFGFVDGLFCPDEIITNGLVLTLVLTMIFRPFITRPVISWSDLSWWNFSIGLIRRSISSIKIALDLVGPRRERKDGFKGVASSGDDSDSKTKFSL